MDGSGGRERLLVDGSIRSLQRYAQPWPGAEGVHLPKWTRPEGTMP